MVLVALGGVLVLVAVAAALAWQQYQDARDAALKATQARTVLAATVFDVYFAGQIAQLNAIADAPVVMSQDQQAMPGFFQRVVKSNPTSFSGGLGWIDLQGRSRVSSNPPAPGEAPVSVADRSYFQQAIKGKPFVSEGLTTRRSSEHVVVMAVPTHDAAGRVSGVLAGALLVSPTPTSQATIDLGFKNLVVLDRSGQSVLAGTSAGRATPRWWRGCCGRPGRPARCSATRTACPAPPGTSSPTPTPPVPGWVVAIDQPRSEVLAAPRRSLALSLAAIAGVAALVLALIIRTVLRARREAEQRDRLTREQAALRRPGGGRLGRAAGLRRASPSRSRRPSPVRSRWSR